jgi:hypothetical protein
MAGGFGLPSTGPAPGGGPSARQIPAEVDLEPRDPIAVEAEDLGVASSAAVGAPELVRDDHLVARLDHPHELVLGALSGPGPAALEVAVAIELRVGRAGEAEALAQMLLEKLRSPAAKAA